MLTYFLEGEDATHRQRRISSSKMFSRTNSPCTPEEDFLVPNFGKSPIHPKYWPNGAVGPWADPEAFQSCDKNNSSTTVCDVSSDSSASVPYDRLSDPNSPALNNQRANTAECHEQATNKTSNHSENYVNHSFSPVTAHAQITKPEDEPTSSSKTPELVSRLFVDRAISHDESASRANSFDFTDKNRKNISLECVPTENHFECIPMTRYKETNQKHF